MTKFITQEKCEAFLNDEKTFEMPGNAYASFHRAAGKAFGDA